MNVKDMESYSGRKGFVLELERGDKLTGLFLDASATLVPAPDNGEKFTHRDVAAKFARIQTSLRDKIGERFVVTEVEMVNSTGWRRVS